MARFADDVECGNKNHSIRARRKVPIKTGERLSLYTGMRTKQCRKLRDTFCTEVETIRIVYDQFRVFIDVRELDPGEIKELAENDGFSCGSEFFEWFRKTHGADFTGDLIHWKPPWD